MLASVWAGILLATTLPFETPVLLALAGVLPAALAVGGRRKSSALMLAAGLFLAGAMRSPEAPGAPTPGRDSPPAVSRSLPVVLRVRLPFLTGQCEDNPRARVEAVMMGDPRLRGAQVALKGLDPNGRYGERSMVVAGSFYGPQAPRNPMAYDMREAYGRAGLAGSVRVGAVLDSKTAPCDRALAGMRRAVARLIAGVPEVEARGVLQATLLGSRAGLLPKVESTMVRAGTYHVLAISGLHVGVLVFMISILATVMRLGRPARVAVSLFLVFAYIVFTGARPSALRAGAFLVALSLARLLEWKIDYNNAVCFAGTALLLLFPALAWDLGFRLSLGAVFGMTLFLPLLTLPVPGRSHLPARFRGWVEKGLVAALSAQVFTMPLILFAFGRMSLLAGLSNLVLLPIMSLALTAGVEAALLAGFLPGIGSVFMRSASVLIALALRLAGWMTAPIDPVVYVGRPHFLWVALYYCFLLWLGLGSRRLTRRVRLGMICVAFSLMLLRVPAAGGTAPLAVTFLYVGNGDACVMELPNRETVVVDTGAASRDYDAAASVILPFLALRGIGSIDRLVVTHSHNDHYGGLPTLVDNFRVGEILVGTTQGEAAYCACLESASRKGVPVRVTRAGDSWEMGGVRFDVLHPGRPGGPGIAPMRIAGGAEDPNAWSIVIRVTYGQRSFLLTGDLTPEAQDSLVAAGAHLACDVLKVPHHGHPGETSPAFARCLSASLAVISCGAKYFAAPDSSTIRLLAGEGMTPLSTMADGAVTVLTDGCDLNFRTVRGSALKLPL